MKLKYNPDYFLTAQPNIFENDELREPQIMAYYEIADHFAIQGKTSHAIVVLPTGVGKTGLMGLIPYGVCEGRVLIITPQLVIKDAVLDSLDPEHFENFWLKRKVFQSAKDLPVLIEYEGETTPYEVMEASNMIVLNIHKLQSRLTSSLLNRVPPDFFDMIIIDEAHHSTAPTWVEAINYFSDAKVVKLTGTPFRTDNEPIVGELVYKYKLSAAMHNKYVKSLENFIYVPQELLLTIDEDDEKKYTVKELYNLGIKDETWVSRSVAYSQECSERIVDVSIEKLEEKLSNDNPVPHKIIAVACSINHANQIKQLYEAKGYPTAIIHSHLEDGEISKALKDIENHRVKVVVNVAMLGEGYDHPYLSIGAIFRPFRHQLPYAQFIGRILRIIPEEEASRPEDNIGVIISHEHLYLKKLWEYYKKEIQECETIRYLEEIELNITTDRGDGKSIDKSIGLAIETGNGKLLSEPYLTTELIKQRKKEKEERESRVRQLQEILNISKRDAERILDQTQSKSDIKRPDIYFKAKRKGIDEIIRYDIVPELISKFDIDKEDDNLKHCRLFNGKFSWIPKQINNNAGMLAVYFNDALRYKIGLKREDWQLSDYDVAYEQLDTLVEYVNSILEGYLKET